MKARYSVMSEDQALALHLIIRRIFLEVWDPIRISDEPDAQNEYNGYIGPVFDMLTRGGSDKEVVKYLDDVVARMGMDGNRVNLLTVVAALRKIDFSDKAGPKVSS